MPGTTEKLDQLAEAVAGLRGELRANLQAMDDRLTRTDQAHIGLQGSLAAVQNREAAVKETLDGIQRTLAELRDVADDVRRAQGAAKLLKWAFGIAVTLLLWAAGPWREHVLVWLAKQQGGSNGQ